MSLSMRMEWRISEMRLTLKNLTAFLDFVETSNEGLTERNLEDMATVAEHLCSASSAATDYLEGTT